jgi:O-antigen/teichoic acid export membrane protein
MISLSGLVVAFSCIYGIAAFINLCYLFSLKRISIKPNFQKITIRFRKEFLFYTLFLMGSALTLNIMPMLGSFFITAKLGLTFAAIYGFARHIVAFIEVPYRSLGSISNPHISQTVRDNNFTETNKLLKKISLHQFLIGSAIFFAIWMNIDLIFQIIPNGENYASGKWVVFILGIHTVLHTSLTSGVAALNFSKYYYYSLIFTLILVTSGIFLNVIFIPIFQIKGAALATICSYIIYFTLLLVLVNWKLKVNSFSRAQLKVLLIVLTLFLLDYIWKRFVTIYFTDNVWISIVESVIRTSILGGIRIFSVYFGNIYEKINALKIKLKLKKINH